MDTKIYITLWAVMAFVCWLLVAGGAVLAVFSKSINDTTLERVGITEQMLLSLDC